MQGSLPNVHAPKVIKQSKTEVVKIESERATSQNMLRGSKAEEECIWYWCSKTMNRRKITFNSRMSFPWVVSHIFMVQSWELQEKYIKSCTKKTLQTYKSY